MIWIECRNAVGEVLAACTHEQEALLCVDRVYEEGDVLVLRCDDCHHLMVQMDAALPAGEVYLPNGEMNWNIPFGEHRLAYCPGAFEQHRHIISARKMSSEECAQRRNLACNPADLRGNTDFFPHCTANVETRGESVFAARNVIDGCRHCISHGEWPYQSWGVGAREDAWCLLDFGRDVLVDEMTLTLRADFPHDAYWVSGHVVMSDGSEVAYNLEKTGDRQYIPLGQHAVRWMRLERMQKSDDPSAFPSLIEWEVFGKDQ
ncbi:MAG: carbohydrate-binding protein [Clostridia bacterium]|nr:carbohydrate-binding protein [Clostridia bacterium]